MTGVLHKTAFKLATKSAIKLPPHFKFEYMYKKDFGLIELFLQSICHII